jgi:hypothetical protein
MKDAILVFAECREPHALGDYKIAGDLAYDFKQELQLAGREDIEVVLVTSSASIHKYEKLYGEPDGKSTVHVFKAPIKIQALEQLNPKDYHVLAYVDANHCKGPLHGYLDKILAPDTQFLFILGPHQMDLSALPSWEVHLGMSQIMNPGEVSFQYFTGNAEVHTLGIGGKRLGLPAIHEVPTLPPLSEPDADKLYFPKGDYSFAYMSAQFGNLDKLLEEYIALSGKTNMLFVGHYEKEFKRALKDLPYGADYRLASGAKGCIPGKHSLKEIRYQQYDSVPTHVMRRALTDGTRLVAVTGASTLIEALLGKDGKGQIVYYQTCKLNQGIVDSYLAKLNQVFKTDSYHATPLKAKAETLAKTLMLPKPLGQVFIQQVKALLQEPTVVDLLSRTNSQIIREAAHPVSRPLLKGIFTKQSGYQTKAQLDAVYLSLKKPGEHFNPSYGQALRRASAKGLLMAVKILINHGAKTGLTIDDCDPKLKRTPLMWALIGKQESVALLLLENDAATSHLDTNGFSILHFAMLSKIKTVIEILVEKGESVLKESIGSASPITIDSFKERPLLSLASEMNYDPQVIALVDKTAGQALKVNVAA